MQQGTAMAGYYPAQTVWQNWNTHYYIGTTTQVTTQTVWVNWNTQYQTAQPQHQYQANQPVTEEVARAMQEHARLLEESRAKAKTKAEALLVEHLTPAQKDSFEKHGMFIVEGSKNNRYRLSRTGAPRKIAGDKDAVSYCIHTSGLPREDELLGFKLLLEANEDEFLRTANATQLAA